MTDNEPFEFESHSESHSESHLSRMRASDEDREQTLALLREALTRGQLAIGEFDERAASVYRTKYRDDLAPLLADLDASAGDRSPSVAGDRGLRVHSGGKGNRLSLGILGASALSGDWHLARAHLSIGFMGATSLDLSEARLTAQETVINAYGLLGAVEITVPEDARVVSDGFGILGAFAVSDAEGVTLRQSELPDHAPVVRVRGLGLLGAVGITRTPRRP